MNNKKLMQSFGSRVKKIRTQRGLTQEELATKMGSAQNYVTRFENDNFKNPTYETLEKFAKALGVSTIAIIADEGSQGEATTKRESGDFFGLQRIPLLSGTVSAGSFTFSFNDWSGETVPMPVKNPENKVAWRIQGNSMSPKYDDGDLAIIAIGVQFMDGDDVVAENGNGVTIKQLKMLKDGSVELRPLNPDYPTIRVSAEDSSDLEILGVVVGCYKAMKRRKK